MLSSQSTNPLFVSGYWLFGNLVAVGWQPGLIRPQAPRFMPNWTLRPKDVGTLRRAQPGKQTKPAKLAKPNRMPDAKGRVG